MGTHTRSKDLARAVAEAAGVGYQQALEMVRVARADGAVPPFRGDKDLADAVAAVIASAPSSTEEPHDGAVAPSSGEAAAEQGGHLGRVVVVASPSGGVGRTTLSLFIASSLGLRLAAQGRKVCILDTGPAVSDLGRYLNVFSPNIEDVLKDPSVREDVWPGILRRMVHKQELGFSALLGPTRRACAETEPVSPALAREILLRLRQQFDYVIVDTPAAGMYQRMHGEVVLPSADLVLVPVAPRLTSLDNADRWMYEICQPAPTPGGYGIDSSRVGVVLNMTREGVGLSLEEARLELSLWSIVGGLPDADEWRHASSTSEAPAFLKKHALAVGGPLEQILRAAAGDETLTA